MAQYLKICPGNLTAFILIMALLGCGTVVSLKLPAKKDINQHDHWLTLGRDNQRRHYASHNVVPPLEIVWKTKVKSVVTDHPLAVGNYILAPTRNGQLYQITYDTGETKGDGRLGPAIQRVPTVEGNILYAGFSLGEKTLVGLNLERTTKTLTREYPHITTAPLYWDNKLYFGTVAGTFFCVNAFSGEEIWEFKANASIQSSPALSDQAIVMADDKGWVYALDITSGLKLWENRLSSSVFSHPVIDESSVFVGTTDGYLYALRVGNGKIIWKEQFSGSIYSSPSIFEDMLYVGNNDHEVVALKKESGEVVWKFKTKGIVNTVPLPSPDYVYVSSWDGHLYVLNRINGNLLFKTDLKKPLKSSPIIYKDLLLVQSANGHLYALANGKYLQDRRNKK